MLSGQKFVVIGLGKSGIGAAKLLLQRGAQVVAFDENPNAPKPLEHPRFELRTGALPPRFWEGATAVVVSPGVPLARPELVACRAAGATMYGEIELAYRAMPAGAGPLLGITGTNGKSTTTALLGELVRQHEPRSFVGGNLGTAFTLAYEKADEQPYELHVIELSSFQLEGIVDARFKVAAILNLTPDHIDRYASHQDYGLAKARIFDTQKPGDFAVVNADDADVVLLSKRAKVPVYGFTLDAQRTNPGFAGLAVGKGDSFSFSFGAPTVFTVRNRALRGNHNLQNAMAAALMARLAGIPDAAIQRGLDSFPGLPHRLEFVRERNGVEWINDSKATNVDSSLVAMKALAGNVWLIAGGKGKGAPYQPLVDAAKGKVKGVLTIGKDAPLIAAAFAGTCPVHDCGTLAQAVAQAAEISTAGDTVLLSPACASYDQFNHFEHRGDVFKSLVRALP
ncbi:MAG: UDP-N-acetylmuramoyl-L-alanine--D-glutamate ligase [Myxococcota bacterium]